MNINTYQDSKLISLTSQTASQYLNSTYLSNVMFETQGFLIRNANLIKLEISLVHAEIPVSFYIINYTNNQFQYKLGTGSIITASIPVGNYNANTLITALQTVVNNVAFLITINKITGVLTFNYNTSFIIYTSNNNTIAKILGLNTAVTSIVSVTNSITASYPLNLLGIKKLNISSSKLTTNNYVSGVGSTSLLACLSVDQPSFGLIIYQNQSGSKYSLGNKEILNIDIQITDESFNYINFNNIDWALLFSITATYDVSIDNNAPLINTIKPEISKEEKPNNDPNPQLEQLEFLTNKV